MRKKVLLLIMTVGLTISFLSVDLKAEVKFKGLFQGWFSYADQDGSSDNSYGFTIRRMRFKPYGTLGKNITWTLQVGWDKQDASLIDAYINVKLSEQFQIRMGQFSAPGTMSGSLTSSGSLDFVERSMVTRKWNSNSGLSGYRALGLQVHGFLAEGKFYYALMVANPKTSSIFTPSVSSSTYSHNQNGLALWARMEAKPLDGIRIGAFFGTSKDDADYVTNSYGGHFIYVKNNINFKAEYMKGKYGYEDMETDYNGFYALLGYKIKKVEPIVRYGNYAPVDGEPDGFGVERYNNITLGLNYYHSKSVKLQVNYIFRSESMYMDTPELKNDLFYMCFQYSYN